MRKKIIRNYYIQMGLVLALYVAALFAVLFLLESFWLQLLCIAACFAAVKLANSFLGYKHFLSILFIEKDAKKFAEVMKPGKGFSPSAPYRMLAAYYSGDHAETVNICTKMLGGKVKLSQKCLIAAVLARTYFELGDDEKLSAACRYFTSCADASGNGEKMRAKFPIMEFLKQYLRGDLAACEAAAEKGKAEEGRAYAGLAAAQSKFFCAVANCRLGESAKAQLLFEEVIYEAPKTHFARMAHTYLDAIALENPALLQNANVLPDESYEIYGKAMRTYLKVRKPAMALVCIFVCVALMFSCTSVYREHGIENFDKGDSSVSLCERLMPDGFEDRFEYIEADYNLHESEQFISYRVCERVMVYFRYSDEVYEEAKAYMLENLSLSEGASAVYGEYFFFDNYENGTRFDFPRHFSRAAYNDSEKTLVFIGFSVSVERYGEAELAAEDWGAFIEKYYGEWYDFG